MKNNNNNNYYYYKIYQNRLQTKVGGPTSLEVLKNGCQVYKYILITININLNIILIGT